MPDFLVHTSINARRYIMDHLKERLQEFERRTGERVLLKNPGNDHSKSWLLESIESRELPDVALSHASDFSVLDEGSRYGLFASTRAWSGTPALHPESAPFHDPSGIFHPVFIVPMVPIYNGKVVQAAELRHSWADLFENDRKVLFPDKDTPISKAVLAYLHTTWPAEYPAFRERLSFGGSPVEVLQAVGNGEFHMGISNVSFSMMAKQRNIEIDAPSEGAVALPQVLVWGAHASSELTALHDLLMEEKLQRYLEEQGFWATADIPEDERMPVARWKSVWAGWDDFFAGLRALEEGERVHA